jgi:hypothetical protein
MPLTILNTTSRVNPTIRNGSSRSQSSGRKIRNRIANGQEREKRISQRIRTRMVFMRICFARVKAKPEPVL